MLFNVICSILVLSIIVIVHEFGHFIVAKANGITVVEFSIGFGPKLLHFKKGETEYCIKLLPFGGACMMLGDEYLDFAFQEEEDEDNDDSDKTSEELEEEKKNRRLQIAKENGFDLEKSFSSKSVWARIAVILAGPLFNFILAFICAVVIVGNVGYDPCIVDKIENGSPATEAGLKEGDKIISINGNRIVFYRDYYFFRNYHADEQMKITVLRDGEKVNLTLNPEHVVQKKYKIGISLTSECAISIVSDNSPAKDAGLQKGDVIKAIDDVKVESNTQITEAITASEGRKLKISVYRDGEILDLEVMPIMYETEGYYTGFASYGAYVKLSPIETLKYSFEEVAYSCRTVVKSLGMMFNGKVTVNDLMGPVGTVSTMSEIVESSKADGSLYVFLNLINLCALISANLGIMNLLPIPALDGGRLVFLILEAIRGKPVKREHEGVITFIGMILLVLLTVYVLFKDIRMLF